jgi:hypothetical protein
MRFLALLVSLAPRAAAAEPGDVTVCLQKHEAAQLARRDGKLRAAHTALLACSHAACPGAIRSDCVDWLTEVERDIPSVVLSARSPKGDELGARVTMDGEVLATRLDGRPVEIDPGEHVFRFEVPPYPPVEQRIVVRTGEKNRELLVTVGDTTAPPPVKEPPRPIPAAFWALGGVTIAGLAVFAGLGGSGLALKSSLQASCAPFCTDAQLQPLRTRFLAADISLGVGAAAAVAAIIVVAVRPARPPASQALPSAPRSYAGLALSVRPTARGVVLGVGGDL